jgi:hypothetical protein
MRTVASQEESWRRFDEDSVGAAATNPIDGADPLVLCGGQNDSEGLFGEKLQDVVSLYLYNTFTAISVTSSPCRCSRM